MPRAALLTLLIGSLLLALLCFIAPAGTVLVEVATPDAWTGAGLGQRRAELLLRGVAVAAAAAGIAVLLGSALACGLVRRRGSPLRMLTGFVCVSVLLTPPYLYAYGWSLPLIPEGTMTAASLAGQWRGWLVTTGRAVWCLGAWIAPVAAFIVAAGWRTLGRPAHRMALLDAGSVRAAARAALPLMWPWLAAAFAAAAVLALTEYSVCHLCLVQTWNTEVLAEIQLLQYSGRGFVLAWPLLAAAAVVAAPLWLMRRGIAAALTDAAAIEDDEAARRGSRAAATCAIFAAPALLAPWGLFLANTKQPDALRSGFRLYREQWQDGLLYAGGAALISAWLAVAVDSLLTAPKSSQWRRLRPAGVLLLLAAVVAALSPPALVGDAFLAAYIHVPLIADHWPVVSAVTAARFAVVAMLIVRLGGRLAHPQYAEMAAADGADFAQTYLRVHLPARLPAALAGGLAAGLLAFTEVAATQLVKPAGVESMATTMLNQIHFGRNEETVAMSLAMMALVAAGAIVAMLLLPRRG